MQPKVGVKMQNESELYVEHINLGLFGPFSLLWASLGLDMQGCCYSLRLFISISRYRKVLFDQFTVIGHFMNIRQF